MSSGGGSSEDTSATSCQWLDELPRLGPVTLNAFDRQLWESLLNCNWNNNDQRDSGASSPAAAADFGRGQQFRRANEIDLSRWRAHTPVLVPSAYRREISALRRASLAYRRLQTVVGRLRRSVERRELRRGHFEPRWRSPATAMTAPLEEEADSSALTQAEDGLTCCRQRRPPSSATLSQLEVQRQHSGTELTTSSSWQSEISARIFVPKSAISMAASGLRPQQQQLLKKPEQAAEPLQQLPPQSWLPPQQQEVRCFASQSHIGATQARVERRPPPELQAEGLVRSRRHSPVTVEFSVDDSSFLSSNSPESLGADSSSREEDYATALLSSSLDAFSGPTDSDKAGAELPRRPLRPPASLQTLLAPQTFVAQLLPNPRSKRHQRQQKPDCRQASRSGCIAVASQRLCPANDGQFSWARRKSRLADSGRLNRISCQCLSWAPDSSQTLQTLLPPLLQNLLLEGVESAGPATSNAVAVSCTAGRCLLVALPHAATALRFVAPEASTPALAAPVAPQKLNIWRGAPGTPGCPQAMQQPPPPPPPLFQWPPPPAGSLISLATPSRAPSRASSSSGGSGGAPSSGFRERLQQQRRLRRLVQVMQMRRKPSGTRFVVAPSRGDYGRGSSCRRCDLLDDLLRSTGENQPPAVVGDLLATLRTNRSSPATSRFYSFGYEPSPSASASEGEGDSGAPGIGLGRATDSGSFGSSTGSSRGLRFATPDSRLCGAAENNNAEASLSDATDRQQQQQQQQQQQKTSPESRLRHRTYYARRCIVRLEESSALLVQEPACRASSVVASCAVEQSPTDSEFSNASCCSTTSTVQSVGEAQRLQCRLRDLQRRTLLRAWHRPPLAQRSLDALDPTVASFMWWSLIPLNRKLQPEPWTGSGNDKPPPTPPSQPPPPPPPPPLLYIPAPSTEVEMIVDSSDSSKYIVWN